jgi:VCBS repeat-containing protein
MTDTTIQLGSGGSFLFVGNSFTFGRVDPVMSYNTDNVRDLTAPVAGTTFANTTGSNVYEPHPWGGVPGIFEAFASQVGLELDVAISARNAATLQGQYLNSNPAGWDLRGNVASQSWDVVVLQDNSTQPLPSGSGSITFAAGSSTATLIIDPTPGTKSETDETIGIQITGSSFYQTSAGIITGTILNDDPTGPVVNPALPTVTLVASPGAVLEDGAQKLVYTFTRTGSTASPLIVNFTAFRDGSTAPSVATGGDFENNSNQFTNSFQADTGQATTGNVSFTSNTGTVTIPAGTSSVTFTLDPRSDAAVENDESIRLTLSTNANYNVGTQGPVFVTILNDDFTNTTLPNISLNLASSSIYEDGSGNLVYQFTRSGSNAASLTVNFSVSGTATLPSGDFTVTGANSFSTAGAENPNLQSFNTYAVKLAQYATTGAADGAIPANQHANPATDVYLYETWARPNMITGALVANTDDTTGAVTNTTTTAPEYYLSLEAMTADLRAAYEGLAAANPIFAGVAPVGAAFLLAVQNGTVTRDPYAPDAGTDGKVDLWWDDNLHASKYGSYLSGLTLFGTLTGLDPRSLGAAEHVASDLDITQAEAAALQGVAAATLGSSLNAHWTAPGQVTELQGGTTGLLATAGSFGFSDSDVNDTHTIAVTPLTLGAVGTFTAELHTDTTGDGTGGAVNWLFTVDNADVAFLAPGSSRVEHFLVTISDANGGLAQRDIAVAINGSYNDAPVTSSDAYATNEDMTLTVPAAGVLGNDTDVDSPSLSSVLVSGPGHGSLTLKPDGSFIYTPDANYNGSDSFTYKANDGSADSNIATAHITINPMNDAPVAHNDAASVTEDQSVLLNVLSNDIDVDGDSLGIISLSGQKSALGAFISIEGNQIRYMADADSFDLLGAGATVADSFTYTVSDGHGGLNTATVNLTVTGDQNNAVVNLGNGDDTFVDVAGGRDTTVRGGNSADTIFGGDGADVLYGENGADTLNGGNGIDFLFGGQGNDRLTGGAGIDTFVFQKSGGDDIITDFQLGLDHMRLDDGLTVKSVTAVDVDHTGALDAILQLSNGSVTLLNTGAILDWHVLL